MNCFVTEGGGGWGGGGGRCGWAEKFTFFAITWIRLIGSRQNLAWTYYLTLGTSLRKNFSFFSKSKMAAGGQSAEDSHRCRGLPSLPIHIFCNNLKTAHRIQTKFGMDILLDPRNNPAEEFSIFLKIQYGRSRLYAANYEIAHNLKSIQLRDPIFFWIRWAVFKLLQ